MKSKTNKKVITIIAIISNSEIVNKIKFEEATDQDALKMAQEFLAEGHFAQYNADDVQIIPCKESQYDADGNEIPSNEYSIDDYYMDKQFYHAEYLAILDEDEKVVEVRKRPKVTDAASPAANEVVVDGEAPVLGCRYVDGGFVEV